MSGKASPSYLPSGLPIPVPEPDGLSAPYWAALRQNRLLVQRCARCHTWQFGPEWLCHCCHGFDPEWTEVAPKGRIFSWERVWHPSHTVLKQHGPYLAVLVELPHAGGVRMVGNLLGDPMQVVTIGAEVEGTFEHHRGSVPPIFAAAMAAALRRHRVVFLRPSGNSPMVWTYNRTPPRDDT